MLVSTLPNYDVFSGGRFSEFVKEDPDTATGSSSSNFFNVVIVRVVENLHGVGCLRANSRRQDTIHAYLQTSDGDRHRDSK